MLLFFFNIFSNISGKISGVSSNQKENKSTDKCFPSLSPLHTQNTLCLVHTAINGS